LVANSETQASCCGAEVGPQPAAEEEGSVTRWRRAFVVGTEEHCSHLGQSAESSASAYVQVLG